MYPIRADETAATINLTSKKEILHNKDLQEAADSALNQISEEICLLFSNYGATHKENLGLSE